MNLPRPRNCVQSNFLNTILSCLSASTYSLFLFFFFSFDAFAESKTSSENDTPEIIAEELAALEAQENERYYIEAIYFAGNKKTQDIVLKNEMDIRQGDTVSIKDIEKDRQSIQNLSLFNRVEYALSDGEHGKILTYTVKEKHYWFILPDFGRSSDGDINYGIDFEYNNLFGLNQYLEVEAERTNYDEGERDNEEVLSLTYRYPKVFGSDYNIGVNAAISELNVNDSRDGLSGEYVRDYDYAGGNISKWHMQDKYAQGLLTGLGLFWQRYRHDLLEGDEGLYHDADIFRWLINIEVDDVNDYLYYRDGEEYGYQLDFSSGKLGSDESFTAHELFFRQYNSLNPDRFTNFNYQLRFAYANETIFGDDGYDIGGGHLLRGYSRDKLEGDTYWLVNTEFLTKIFGERTLRGVVFADVGNISKEPDEGLFDSARAGVGFGLRYKLRFLVKTDLRFDTAWGIGPESETRFYFGTRVTF